MYCHRIESLQVLLTFDLDVDCDNIDFVQITRVDLIQGFVGMSFGIFLFTICDTSADAVAAQWHLMATGGDASGLDAAVCQGCAAHGGSPGYEGHHAEGLGDHGVQQHLVWSGDHLSLDICLPLPQLDPGHKETEPLDNIS